MKIKTLTSEVRPQRLANIDLPIDITSHYFPDHTPIQKRFNDVDYFGHVNNNIHQSYFDVGRANYLYKIFPNFQENTQIPIIVSIKTDFLEPIHFSDEIEVCTTIYEIGEKSLKMLQLIVSGDKFFTVSTSVMVLVDTRTRKSVVINEEVRKKITFLEKNI